MMKCALLLVVLFLASTAFAGENPQELSGPEAIFENLWKTYDVNYALFGAKSIDWDALYRVYRPQVTPQTSDDELFTILSGLLGHLNDNHVNLISEDPPRNFNAGILGEHFSEIGMETAREMLAERPLPTHYFQGEQATTEDGVFLYGRVADDIGYLHFGLFRDPEVTAADIDLVLGELAGVRAMIVDVRHNRGGDDRVGKLIADRFADCRRLYMVTRNRISSDPDPLGYAPPRFWHVEPDGENRFAGPVILLQNRFSVSAADNFALAMRVIPQVTAVGDFTSGCFADANGYLLPNGWRCTYAHNRFDDYTGFCWEGIGVPPDIMVRGVGAVDGRDRAFEIARALLESGPPALQDESASKAAARTDLVVSLTEDFRAEGYETARLNFLTAQKDLPSDSWYVNSEEMMNIAEQLMTAGRMTEGLGLFDLHAQAFPDYMIAHYRLGNTLLRLGRIEPAMKAYDRALALNRLQHTVEKNAFAGITLRRGFYTGGATGLATAFHELRVAYPDLTDHNLLNTLGYELLGAEQAGDAIDVFRLNVEIFPEYANGYDSLGEAYMINGDKELAITNYNKSLELDPGNDNARAMLERLTEE